MVALTFLGPEVPLAQSIWAELFPLCTLFGSYHPLHLGNTTVGHPTVNGRHVAEVGMFNLSVGLMSTGLSPGDTWEIFIFPCGKTLDPP